MTYYFDLNVAPSTYEECWYRLKEIFKLAGWSVSQSSDASTFANSDLITTSSVLSNNLSWFVMTQPVLDGYQKHLCFQMSDVANKFGLRLKISWTGFPNATVATQTPVATDEQVIFGGGTNVSPTFSVFFDNSNINRVRLNLIAGNAANDYMVACIGSYRTVGGIGSLMLIDKLIDNNPLDIDPYVYIIGAGTSYPTAALNSGTSMDPLTTTTQSNNLLNMWIRKGYSNEFFGKGQMNFYNIGTSSGSNVGMMGVVGPSPYDGVDMLFPSLIFLTSDMSGSAFTCYKGKLKNVFMSGTAKSALDTFNNKSRIVAGVLALPWDGITTPIV